MAPAATRRRLACRARRVRRERGRRAGGAWVRRTRSDGRAPRSCVRSARFVSSTIRVGIPEADWADLGAAAELTPSGARDARSGRRTSCPVDLAVQQSDDPLAGESSTRHGSAQRLATVPLRYESGRDGRRSRLGREAAVGAPLIASAAFASKQQSYGARIRSDCPAGPVVPCVLRADRCCASQWPPPATFIVAGRRLCGARYKVSAKEA
jgi:hypothetical protein